MNEKLRRYIDDLFANAPSTVRAVELKEELYQNLTDKYNDLIAEGKLAPGQVDVRFLAMVTTNHFGERPADAPAIAVPATTETTQSNARITRSCRSSRVWIDGVPLSTNSRRSMLSSFSSTAALCAAQWSLVT